MKEQRATIDYIFSILHCHKLLSITKGHNQILQRTGQQIFIKYFSVEIPTFLDNPLVSVVKDLFEP